MIEVVKVIKLWMIMDEKFEDGQFFCWKFLNKLVDKKIAKTFKRNAIGIVKFSLQNKKPKKSL